MTAEPVPSQGGYTIGIGDREWSLGEADVARFAMLLIRDADIRSRTSRLLHLDLFVGSREFGLNPGAVIQEMEHLEGKGRGSRGTKIEAEFTRKPLAGLWHKHYFDARFMARNIQTGLANGRLRKIIEAEMSKLALENPSGETPMDVLDASSRRIASLCVEETLQHRRNQSAVTGERIIYAKHNGSNYYLCLGSHREGDHKIRDRIEEFCLIDFPFLVDTLTER